MDDCNICGWIVHKKGSKGQFNPILPGFTQDYLLLVLNMAVLIIRLTWSIYRESTPIR